MLQFDFPYAFIFLILPVLIRLLLPAQERSTGALQVPFFQWVSQMSASKEENFNRSSKWLVLAGIIWVLLVLSAAAPKWVGDPVKLPLSGRSLMLAVDLSGSMKEKDLKLGGKAATRLQVIKSVLKDFIQRRKGDRVGLILFGDQAYLQTPLTFDLKTVGSMLADSELGLAGKRTAIGTAIGLATKRLRKLSQEERVLILLTDGQNTAGEVSPKQAAQLAAQSGVRVYTIGVGADVMYIRSLFGIQKFNPSAELDEAMLQEIANKTGGRYFRARSTQELEKIYQLLDELEPIEHNKKIFRPIQSLFYIPLGIALLLSLLWGLAVLFFSSTSRSRSPNT